MKQEQSWFVGVDGNQRGPMPTSAVVAEIQSGTIAANAYVFTQGMANWMSIRSVQPFAVYFGGAPAAPPPMPQGPRPADAIDFQLFGEEMQYVEITLDPGEACLAEAGGLLYMEPGIEMKTIFGDGRHAEDETITDAVIAAGSRVLTGESLALTEFRNTGSGPSHVTFASPYPGKIVPLDLSQHNGKVVCQKDAFLCAAKGVRIGIEFQRKIGAGLLGGEGFILQKLEGDGLAFVHAGGHVFSRELQAGETIRLDTGCLVGFIPTVEYDVEWVGGIANAVFGGEGLFLATLKGPGTVWLQTLPFSRLAGRIYAAAPQTGGARVGEGSVLGRAGDFAMGSGGPQMPNMDVGTVLGAAASLLGKK